MKQRILAGILGLAAAGLLTGCIGLTFGGGGPKHQETSIETTPTLGKQLMDLKQARDRGAITEQEYEFQKAKLLSK